MAVLVFDSRHCTSVAEGSEVERDGVEGQQDWENWGALEGDEDSSDEEVNFCIRGLH